jgi:hypothetical protein
VEGQARSGEVVCQVVRAAQTSHQSVLKIHRAWIENPEVACFVYESAEQAHGRLGLRRTVEQSSEWTVEGIVDEILTCEMGEPLGSCFDTLEADGDGVLWWTGNRAEWKAPR